MSAAAQEKGSWRAVSSTAQSITGDVVLSQEKLSINFSSFPMVRVRGLKAEEISAAFNAESGAGGSGSLYKIDIPGLKKFLHKNTLCGTDEIQWMATYVSGKSLQLAFFSSQSTPLFTAEAIGNSTSLCGTFTYGR
jgi:hypothetical protein